MAKTFKMLSSVSYIHSMKDSAILLEEAIRSSERIGMANLTGKRQNSKESNKVMLPFYYEC